MGEPYVSQNAFDEYKEYQRELRKADDRDRAQLRSDLGQLRADRDDDIKDAVAIAVGAAAKEAFKELRTQNEQSIKAAVSAAVTAAFQEIGATRRATRGERIAEVAAGAGVVAACVAVIALWQSSGR